MKGIILSTCLLAVASLTTSTYAYAGDDIANLACYYQTPSGETDWVWGTQPDGSYAAIQGQWVEERGERFYDTTHPIDSHKIATECMRRIQSKLGFNTGTRLTAVWAATSATGRNWRLRHNGKTPDIKAHVEVVLD